MCRYNIFIKTRLGEDWEVREVIVPPVAKHNVEKVKHIYHCLQRVQSNMNRDLQSTEYLNPPRQNDLFNKYFTM